MKRLTKSLTKAEISTAVNYTRLEDLPEKVVQFGEGNFLRCFIDWMLQQMNNQGVFNGRAVLVQPIAHGPVIDMLNEQDGLYTVVLRGIQNGETVDTSEVISSVSRGLNPYTQWEEVLALAASPDLEIVFSNTTEAGITYLKEAYVEGKTPESYPAKLTSFLFCRFQELEGSGDSGLVIVPCELIEENAIKLKELVLRHAAEWELPKEFVRWINEDNHFCNTLVDRIVTGYPKDSVDEFHRLLGYEDKLITVGEPYHMFAVDGDETVQEKIPFHKAGLNIRWGDITPHRELKVRLLNGPHTMMFSVAYLAGVDTVLQAMEDAVLRKFIDKGFHELTPTVYAGEDEKNAFVQAVTERFLNPYNKHFLLDIGLNAVYKFKSRLLPSVERYIESKGTLPKTIVFSLAALFAFYRPVRRDGKALVGERDGMEYTMRENENVIDAIYTTWNKFSANETTLSQFVATLLGDTSIWDKDLNNLPGLTNAVTADLQQILEQGMRAAVEALVSK
ncbi:tagaturonate reductase [Evansella caseinilytica]|uniref:Tagaturonate reductase n=1 Tax=Evansella caseinilytica TaxID=1503961 RepID=A0A1H3NX04_9BACI|nr:tagaturonate reductase [Evansella caseinilytica]SDY93422.1 tagaturonate reductase [Evansella caseinilytica]